MSHDPRSPSDAADFEDDYPSECSAREAKLTDRQRQVLAALSWVEFFPSGKIAKRAAIRTSSPRETAAKYCIQLVKLGFAMKGGTRMWPTWCRIKPVPMSEMNT